MQSIDDIIGSFVLKRKHINARHFAFLLKKIGKNFQITRVFGYNRLLSNRTEHAEIACLNNIDNRMKLTGNFQLLVIRMSKTNKLAMSRPCSNCIKKMIKFLHHTPLNINKIYYSEDDGSIACNTLFELFATNEQHISYYYRRKIRHSSVHMNI